MNYKSIALIALLLPVAIISYGKSVETRIKELKEAQYQKRIELSALGKIISEKDDSINVCNEKRSELLYQLLEKKVQILRENNGGKEPQKEEIEKIRQSIKDSMGLFIKKLLETNNESEKVKNFFVKELFDQERGSFESIRFSIVRLEFETDLLVSIVEKYEVCVEELIKINQELASLEK